MSSSSVNSGSSGDLKLLLGGEWSESESEDKRDFFDPAVGSVIGRVPFSTKEEVNLAVESAERAFESWKALPITDRARFLFKMKEVLEANAEELAMLNTRNHGKTLEESRGDVKRTIENVDVAISIAHTLAKGTQLDQISPGIDEEMTKEPIGVFAIICPFNFPVMIPFWFLPYAIVLGDTVVVKPSEITPLPMQRVASLIQDQVKLPPGVFNLVHGGSEVVESLIANESTKGVTFVGSSPVARKVYRLAGEHGKRAIANGGAKNSIVVMPDADIDLTVPSIISSFFGNSGQRCLAGANLLLVGEAKERVLGKFANVASRLKIGPGVKPDTQMGPVVSAAAKERILKYVQYGLDEGANIMKDGRATTVAEFPGGFYLGATIFEGVAPDMKIAKDEIFGPVASTLDLEDLDSAIDMINMGTDFGNMASIFTSNGRAAREFRRGIRAGNIGVNIGVAAPSANFPFGGMKGSFFGVLHPQIDTVDFFTDRKITITRW
jgi:malonate-semialdehyde dehydrogenase (acetylating)/methylmalonate-semialdehyde dehydrogenase